MAQMSHFPITDPPRGSPRVPFFKIIVLSKLSADISEICPNPEPKIDYFELFT